MTKLLRKHLLFIILFVLIVEALLCAVVFFWMPERYDSQAMLLVSRTAESLDSESYELDKNLLATYREITTSDKVLRAAINEAQVNITPEELRQRVRVTSAPDTTLVSIRVWSNNPEISAKLANALREALVAEIQESIQIDNVRPIDAAKPAVSQSRAHFAVILGIGFAASLVLAILIVCLREYYDDTLRSSEQVADLFGKPVIGQIPHGVTRLRRH